ncbi:CLUMA_CG011769, isoform A [Clunio marinus]|uniref:CLUMA_CG011769, isoform A n=1 Tax=Clunio marinus TaxID=568069 RepID=A0A1J1IDX0_9DIPT|nr:CLUMA_CG011769, isoform A [Clunio marinus]
MVRQVICDNKLRTNLHTTITKKEFSIGLIIGQIVANGADYVVHFAKTSISSSESDSGSSSESKKKQKDPPQKLNIAGINNNEVAEHALNALRMLSGGFNILGLYVVSESNIMSDNSALEKLKTILMDIKSTLNSNGLLYANTDDLDQGNKLILNYTFNESFICKTISTDPSKAVASNPIDWKFAEKTSGWQIIETYYEIDTYFPLPHTNNHWRQEKHVMDTIDVIANTLKESLLFFDGRSVEKEMNFKEFKETNWSEKELRLQNRTTKVTIYSKVPKLANNDDGSLKASEDLARYTGVISSRVNATDRNTIGDIENFIRQDIVRSLTTRLQIYYDALLANDDGGNDDESEHDMDINNTTPPMRVYFNNQVPNVVFCDYLFEHETLETTVKTSMDIMGNFISEEKINDRFEKRPQFLSSSQQKSETSNDSRDKVLAVKDKNRMILMVGISGALVGLVIALVARYIFRSQFL